MVEKLRSCKDQGIKVAVVARLQGCSVGSEILSGSADKKEVAEMGGEPFHLKP